MIPKWFLSALRYLIIFLKHIDIHMKNIVYVLCVFVYSEVYVVYNNVCM